MTRLPHRLLILVVGLVVTCGGCTNPDIDGNRWRCGHDNECGAGWHCQDGVCMPGPAPDVLPEDTNDASTDVRDGDTGDARPPDVGPDIPDAPPDIDVPPSDTPPPDGEVDTPQPVDTLPDVDAADQPSGDTPSDVPPEADGAGDLPADHDAAPEVDGVPPFDTVPDLDAVPDAEAGADTDADADAEVQLGPGEPCIVADQCGSGVCQDGVCCQTACDGLCETCAAPDHAGECTPIAGGNDPDIECPACHVCDAGACVPVSVGNDPKDDCVQQPPETCGTTGTCAGDGACAAYPDETVCGAAACVGDAVTSYACESGVCTPRQTSCGGYRCADEAHCYDSCTPAGDQCASDYFCEGNLCRGGLGLGEPCVLWSQCASDQCVDDVCCESSCDGTCESCVADVPGSCAAIPAGSDPAAECEGEAACSGTCDGARACAYPAADVRCEVCRACDGAGACLPVTAGIDPYDDCTDLGPEACAADGSCDGAGACRLYAAGTVCAEPTCAEGALHTAHCEDGLCAPAETSCLGYACASATDCLSACTSSVDCVAAYHCVGPTCVADFALGTPCSAGDQCETGLCVDGRCCDSPCGGPCEACNLPLQPGVCGPEPAGTVCDAGQGACGPAGCEPFAFPLPAGLNWTHVGAGPTPQVPSGCGGAGLPCNLGEFRFHWPPDTRQTVCFDGQAALPSCPGAAGSPECATTAFCGQDAQYGFDVHAPEWLAGRFSQQSTPTGDVVIDHWTRRSWLKSAASSRNWAAALAYCEGLNQPGVVEGWRLPDDFEWLSLLAHGRTFPASAFPAPLAGSYWTAATLAANASEAWALEADRGALVRRPKGEPLAVHCVRVETDLAYPRARYFEALPAAGGRVVFDTRTGLLWQGAFHTNRTWSEALSGCEGLSYGGRTDWRLPTILELRSIVDTTRGGPAFDSGVFSIQAGSVLLSATSGFDQPNYAWAVRSEAGDMAVQSKSSRVAHLCVTEGPPWACIGDNDCGPGMYCGPSGVCTSQQAQGEFCERDEMCQTLNCRAAPSGALLCVEPGAACSDEAGRGLAVGEATCEGDLSQRCEAVDTFAAEACTGDVPCNAAVCDDATGLCALVPFADGSLCGQGSGACDTGECVFFLHPPPDGFDWAPVGQNPAVAPSGCGGPTLPCNTNTFRFLWPADTGSLACYDNAGLIGCPGEPGSGSCGTTDFCGQDAQYGPDVHGPGWDEDRFVEAGSPAEPVIRDFWSGLVWTPTPQGPVNWAVALDACASLGDYGDLTGWRLPTLYELEGLLAPGRTAPASAFPGLGSGSISFWSATSGALITASAVYVDGQQGRVDQVGKTTTRQYLCINDSELASPASQRFYEATPVAGNPVVYDTRTGLLWQRSVNSTSRVWTGALRYCESLSYAARDDWRLPTVLELASIVDATRSGPAIDPAVFPGTAEHAYWTATTLAFSPDMAWTVVFSWGNVEGRRKTSDTGPARCVSLGP